jgi:hypothetical protein
VHALSRDSVAQSFVIGEETYGVTISSPSGKVVSPELVIGPKCTLTNSTSKDIVSYAIVWTAVTASGGSVNLGRGGNASPVLQPNQSLEVTGSGRMGSSPEDPIVTIRLAVDQAVFSDGSEAGKNTLSRGLQSSCSKVISNFRRQLFQLYQEKGLDALLQELRANQN